MNILTWREYISGESSKLKVYSTFKKNFEIENYILRNSFNVRHNFSKLRISAHNLYVETGRHQKPKISREQRFCFSCSDRVENKFHFLLECNLYTQVRDKFQNYIPNYLTLSDEEQFLFLMSGKWNGILNYCNVCFDLREKALGK